ncbi:MAG TPA: TMEM175 family protein [Actinocatenispora sp.]
MADKPHALERMIFFSDAVIAIMLTLLALELPVPDVDDPTQLWQPIAAHGSEYIAFLLSFSVIAATWTAHHMLFTNVVRSDPALLTLNLLSLFGYVLVPWASKTLGESHGGAGVVVYAAAMTWLGGFTLLVVRHVGRAGLLDPAAPPAIITGIRAWSAATTIMFAVSVPLAFVVGRWVIVAWPLVYLGLRLVAEIHIRTHRRDPRAEVADAR